MCTVSWFFTSNGYHLFFNRDELRTRLAAVPPAVRQISGVAFLAPTDGDSGGTWLGVNDYGLSVGLLNFYPADIPPAPAEKTPVSRGLLVLDLLHSRSIEEALVNIRETNLQRFRPFILLLLTPMGQIRSFTWDGKQGNFARQAPRPPLTSSSFRSQEISAHRKALFHQQAPGKYADPDAYQAYHCSHIPKRNAFAVCMHRPDAHTVSFSHIWVDERQAHYIYTPGAPCSVEALPAQTLARKDASS